MTALHTHYCLLDIALICKSHSCGGESSGFSLQQQAEMPRELPSGGGACWQGGRAWVHDGEEVSKHRLSSRLWCHDRTWYSASKCMFVHRIAETQIAKPQHIEWEMHGTSCSPEGPYWGRSSRLKHVWATGKSTSASTNWNLKTNGRNWTCRQCEKGLCNIVAPTPWNTWASDIVAPTPWK